MVNMSDHSDQSRFGYEYECEQLELNIISLNNNRRARASNPSIFIRGKIQMGFYKSTDILNRNIV